MRSPWHRVLFQTSQIWDSIFSICNGKNASTTKSKLTAVSVQWQNHHHLWIFFYIGWANAIVFSFSSLRALQTRKRRLGWHRVSVKANSISYYIWQQPKQQWISDKYIAIGKHWPLHECSNALLWEAVNCRLYGCRRTRVSLVIFKVQ